jgi:hypothetical protein
MSVKEPSQSKTQLLVYTINEVRYQKGLLEDEKVRSIDRGVQTSEERAWNFLREVTGAMSLNMLRIAKRHKISRE